MKSPFQPRFVSLFILALAVAAPSLNAQSAYATELTGYRYTDLGPSTYKQEMGTLYADPSKGFIPSVALNGTYDSYSPPRAEIQAISGKIITKLTYWTSLNDILPNYVTQNFSRSAQTYNIEGVPYVIIASRAGGGGGDGGIVITPAAGPRFLNLSFRAVVPANGAIIPGFVVADDGSGNALRVLLRVAGPTLGSLGVSGTLADPKFTIYDAQNKIVGGNDNWAENATEAATITATGGKVGAFPYLPGSKDAAAVVSLTPGNYTAIINGAKDTSGEVIFEVYTIEK